MDLHYIAQDQTANPITAWDVRTVDENVLVGVLEAHGASITFAGECGESGQYDSFYDARNSIAEMFNVTLIN